ncbi:MAG: response regulator [Betaproteobacteria bacterium]
MAKILFVDDSRDSADTLETFFKLLGHETAVAYDGECALETAASFPFDIAFIDLQMPMLDGFDTAKAIALTGQDWSRSRLEADIAGFDGYIQKPARASDLVAIVDALPH